jgi:hypothetical protein
LQYQHQAANYLSSILKNQIQRNNAAVQLIIFSKVLIEDSIIPMDDNILIYFLSFFEFSVEAVVEVGESYAQV